MMGMFFNVAILGLIPALIAKNKGHNFFLWWLYGTVLFIVALPHSIILKPNRAVVEKKQLEGDFKKCPFCAELIKKDAVVCRYCRREVPEEVEEPHKEIRICPKCNGEIDNPEAIVCWHCGKRLPEQEPAENVYNDTVNNNF